MHQKNQNKQHIPVLLEEVLAYLNPRKGDTFLDLTAGYGGHSEAVLERTLNGKKSVLVDRDHNAIVVLKEKFNDQAARIIHKDFLSAARELKSESQQFDIILADLGVSSPHLNMASRGFAIAADGPLDMRMDTRQLVSAETIVNNYSEAALVDILRRFGEEPRAKKIARLIVEHRPLSTTTQLASLIARIGAKRKKVHPATKSFQAIRIAVNNELELLQDALPIWMDNLLAPGGRIAVISFHSLEDRIVKHAFAQRSKDIYEASLQLLTKHPITASQEELVFNPRARSAKLRAAVKINNQKERGAEN